MKWNTSKAFVGSIFLLCFLTITASATSPPVKIPAVESWSISFGETRLGIIEIAVGNGIFETTTQIYVGSAMLYVPVAPWFLLACVILIFTSAAVLFLIKGRKARSETGES